MGVIGVLGGMGGPPGARKVGKVLGSPFSVTLLGKQEIFSGVSEGDH